jgi:phosphoribosylanthranilate isomerase
MEGKLKIKVCGMRDPSNLEAVCTLAPDYIGYIFFRGSPRYVGEKPDKALFTIPANSMTRVGVFVNEELDVVRGIVHSGILDMVQLHGDESPEYCHSLASEGIRVIRSADAARHDSGMMGSYLGAASLFLFDTPDRSRGGTGRKFEWNLLDGYRLPVPYLLGGGIGPGDAGAIKKMDRRWLHGVDVNSRFEVSPGIKETGMLEQFIKEIRNQG